MKNLVFIGMPAVGKSTVGVIVAKSLGYDFVDTDLIIQAQEQRLLKTIIEEDGIEGFLAIENQVNRDLEVENTVIAPGGSVIYCEEAMEAFKTHAHVIYLKVSYEEINRRIRNAKNRGVVLRENQTLQTLYEERTALCEKYADITVEEDGKTVEETINDVLEICRNL